MRSTLASAIGLALLIPCHGLPAYAGPDEFDPATLASLEVKAQHASLRDQVYLYADLMHRVGEIASRQLTAGSSQEAAQTLLRVERLASLIDAGVGRDAHKLKDAEILMRETAARLQGALHQAPVEDRPSVEHTLSRVDALEAKVMAQVFAR